MSCEHWTIKFYRVNMKCCVWQTTFLFALHSFPSLKRRVHVHVTFRCLNWHFFLVTRIWICLSAILTRIQLKQKSTTKDWQRQHKKHQIRILISLKKESFFWWWQVRAPTLLFCGAYENENVVIRFKWDKRTNENDIFAKMNFGKWRLGRKMFGILKYGASRLFKKDCNNDNTSGTRLVQWGKLILQPMQTRSIVTKWLKKKKDFWRCAAQNMLKYATARLHR